MNGKVKWFNNLRGYGFLTGEDGKDIFVHHTNIISDEKYKTLDNKDKVTFDVEDNKGKPQAVNVKKLDK